MVRTAEPHSRMRILLRSLARSQNARSRLGSPGVVPTSSGNSSRTSSSGSSRLTVASVSKTSSQSPKGRLRRSRRAPATTGAVSLERIRRSSVSGRAAPVWKITLFFFRANSCRSAVFPTRRRPQTSPSAPVGRSHHSSRACSSLDLLTKPAMEGIVTDTQSKLQRLSVTEQGAGQAGFHTGSRRSSCGLCDSPLVPGAGHCLSGTHLRIARAGVRSTTGGGRLIRFRLCTGRPAMACQPL